MICLTFLGSPKYAKAVSGDNLLSITKLGRNISVAGSLPSQSVTAGPSDIVEYTLEIRNNSGGTLANARFFDRIEQEMSYVVGSGSNNPTLREGAIEWFLNLNAGQTVVISYQAKVRPTLGTVQIIEVSPTGQYKTLSAARNAIRQLSRPLVKPIDVLIHGGDYTQDTAFELLSNDSGEQDKPITYKAVGDDPVLVSGGKRINGEWTKPQGDWNQIHQITLDADTNTPMFNSLFVEDTRATRARTPNLNPVKPKEEYFKITNYPTGFDGDICKSFYFDSANNIQSAWTDSELEVVTLRRWEQSRSKLGSSGSINQADKSITTTNPLPKYTGRLDRCFDWEYSIDSTGNKIIDARFYLENFLPGLDSPGEWFLKNNGTSKTLYYWPKNETESIKLINNKARVIFPAIEQIMKVTGTSQNPIHDINFSGLNFAYSDWKLPQTTDAQTPPRYYQNVYGGGQSARENHYYYSSDNSFFSPPISISYANRINFSDNKIYHVGGYGIYAADLENSTINNNQMFDLGSGGIALGDWNCDPDNVCDTDNNIITNNIVNDYGIVFSEASGIWVKMSQNSLISHNEISNGQATGISVGWKWQDSETGGNFNEISYNHVWSVMKRMYDGAAIYTLGKQKGTTIRYNLIHNIATVNPRGNPLTTSPATGLHAPKAFGIYLDQGSDLVEASYNLVFDTSSAFMRNFDIGDTNPTQNLIENNIFVIKSYEKDYAISMTRINTLTQTNTFRKNVVFVKNNTSKTSAVFHLLKNVDINNAPWDNNLYYVENRGLLAQYWFQALLKNISTIIDLGVERNSFLNTQDPRFIGRLDGEFEHYLLQSNSPMINQGFDKTNFDAEIIKAGPQ